VYAIETERDPYRFKITTPHGQPVTLRHLKHHLPLKRGLFRYYFKQLLDGCFVFEEKNDDNAILPVCDDNVIYAKVHLDAD